MSLYKDMVIDNLYFGGRGDYHLYKASQAEMKFYFIVIKMIFSILLFIFMLVGWIIQFGLGMLSQNSENKIVIFVLTHKFPRLLIGFGTLALIQFVGQTIEQSNLF